MLLAFGSDVHLMYTWSVALIMLLFISFAIDGWLNVCNILRIDEYFCIRPLMDYLLLVGVQLTVTETAMVVATKTKRAKKTTEERAMEQSTGNKSQRVGKARGINTTNKSNKGRGFRE